MRYHARPIRLTLDAAVRLLLMAVIGLALAGMVLVSSEQATAQSVVVGPYDVSRDEIVAQLGARYKETPVAGGIASNGNVLEVFSSADGLSWTIIVTRPDGMSSVIAEGEGWSFITAIKGLRV
jgi:hypothetical protein